MEGGEEQLRKEEIRRRRRITSLDRVSVFRLGSLHDSCIEKQEAEGEGRDSRLEGGREGDRRGTLRFLFTSIDPQCSAVSRSVGGRVVR